MLKQWALKRPLISYSKDEPISSRLSKIYGIENLKDFLDPSEEHVISPYRLKNIKEMVKRIILAITNGENIVIYADVDFDGCASAVILYKYLLKFTSKVKILYVQRSEGHGMKYVLHKIPKDTDLFIAVDSSTNDVDESGYLLYDLGIDVLIIDHHQQTKLNPYALIVNPQQEGCKYENKDACGALVVYKVCQVLDDQMKVDYSTEFADLPGFALAADMMKMDKDHMENRWFFHYSLSNLKHVGLKELFSQMGSNINKLKGTDFTFGVSPAISAATRLDHIEDALELLLEFEPTENTHQLASRLVEWNEERKKLEAETFQRLHSIANTDNKVLIFYDPTISKGIRGLAAQQLMQAFNRPVIVLGHGENSDEYAGSYRSPEDVHFMNILNECEYALYGAGHPPAGGTAVKIENLELLQKELNEKLEAYTLDNSSYYVLEFKEKEITESLIVNINDFYRVTGNGFSEGKFMVTDLFPTEKQLMGKLRNTVKADCGKIKLMKFKTNEAYFDNFPIWSDLNVIGTLNINLFERYNRAKKKKEIEKTFQIFIDSYEEV